MFLVLGLHYTSLHCAHSFIHQTHIIDLLCASQILPPESNSKCGEQCPKRTTWVLGGTHSKTCHSALYQADWYPQLAIFLPISLIWAFSPYLPLQHLSTEETCIWIFVSIEELIFIEHLLCGRHCSRKKEKEHEQNGLNSLPARGSHSNKTRI